MSKYSVLSLDLNSATAEQRKIVYAYLEKKSWSKTRPTTTFWTASWKDDVSDEAILRTTKEEVAAAAKEARLSAYDATTSIGTKPVSWSAS